MSGAPTTRGSVSRRRCRSGGALTKSSPPGVKCLMPVVGREVGPALAALRAQTGAIGLAERRQREGQHERVADRLLDVDLVVHDPRELVGVSGLVGEGVRVGEQLADLHGDLVGQRVEAAGALALQLRVRGAGEVYALG